MHHATMPAHIRLWAALALTGLVALAGCSTRKPIPLDQPRTAAKAQGAEQAPSARQVQSAPAKPAKPAQVKAAPAKPAEPAPAQAAPEKAVAETPAAPAEQTTQSPLIVTVPQAYVQVGAFGTAMNALGAVAWLKDKGFDHSRMVRVEQGQGALYKVQAGPFQDLAAAHKALEALKPDWPQAFIPAD